MEATERNTLAFGCKRAIPEGTETAWGCRAIYYANTGAVDYVWDRQSSYGEEAELRELFDKLNDGLLDRVREEARGAFPYGSEEEVTSFTENGVTVAYSPQGSYGYLYVAAFPVEEES